jgi:hypothetical protein
MSMRLTTIIWLSQARVACFVFLALDVVSDIKKKIMLLKRVT